jgi:isopentenyl-diphosphate Delta-isomerase
MATLDTTVYDADQIKMMEERCILLDNNDNIIGSDTKKNCHLLDKNKKTLLHRAFSVFLFGTDGRLLLQKRSSEKITFPSYWANTCCSHPLYDLPGEQDGANGVIVAARRKLQQELGIHPEQVPISSFTYLTRVHYQSPCDDQWGEHEIDYVLICHPDCEVEVNPNPNEVAEVRWFNMKEMKDWMKINTNEEVRIEKVSPWYRIIHDTFLYKWWNSLSDLETVAERTTIFRGEGSGFLVHEVDEKEESKR